MKFFIAFSIPFLLGLSPPTLEEKISDAAQFATLDPKLVQAIIKVESNFKPHATSEKGAMGLMQVMPSFADNCGIASPYHTMNNLMGACRCLRKLINRYQGKARLSNWTLQVAEPNRRRWIRCGLQGGAERTLSVG